MRRVRCSRRVPAGQSVSVETFLSDVAALAELLPNRGSVVNLCNDRSRFVVGFAAALRRGQVNLLPPHDAPDLLERTANRLSRFVLPD